MNGSNDYLGIARFVESGGIWERTGFDLLRVEAEFVQSFEFGVMVGLGGLGVAAGVVGVALGVFIVR